MKKCFSSIVLVVIGLCASLGQTTHSQVSIINETLRSQSIVLDELFVTDHYTSNGITHTYFKESIKGIPIYNSRGALHHKIGFEPIVTLDLIDRKKEVDNKASVKLSASDAVLVLAEREGVDVDISVLVIAESTDKERTQKIKAEGLSSRPIDVKLQYLVTDEGALRLVWELAIEDPQTAWLTDYFVDAQTGEVLDAVSWTVSCNHGSEAHDDSCSGHCEKIGAASPASATSENLVMANTYQVYAWPVESPNFGARTAETAPWEDNLLASPSGWHTIGTTSFTTTRGNNTDTYLDDDNTNSPTGGDAARADGGGTLEFIFDLDVNQDPTLFKEAAITNTFYWTNIIHDVLYNYGFDEQSGNFQEENYSLAGLGADFVMSEVQDGSGTCNANFGTPPDGGKPRMQMYLCNGRDGDFDNGVIVHEYGHGVSNRLTGGPAAAGCLNNAEQMGEGWSDYLGMVMTIEPGDMGADSRGMGTWLFGEGPDGDGIRPYPYSTDLNINPSTYDNIKTFSVPHGVGSVWCTMLWDMTWALIDEYGFDLDLYNGQGGNNIALELVMEGMKLQPCRPGFIDGRDAILAADELLYGGANKCLIWRVFARRGLGASAQQGASTSRSDGTEAFDLPVSCQAQIIKSTVTTDASAGEEITYDLTVFNNLDVIVEDFLLTDTIPEELEFVSATNGGTVSGGVVSFPLFDVAAESSVTNQVVLRVKSDVETVFSDLSDDMEMGSGNWATSSSGSISWALQSGESNSGSMAWYVSNPASAGQANLDLVGEVGVGDSSEISFVHRYDTEVAYDGGSVLISTDGGIVWQDLGARMINNGYRGRINNRYSGFSGNSGGYIQTVIDLSIYAGKKVMIRFQMNCDGAGGGDGWYLDDFVFTNITPMTINKAAIKAGVYEDVDEADAVRILPSLTDLSVTLATVDLNCFGDTNGEANVSVTGGTGTYSYVWEDGVVGAFRADLSAGAHEVIVSDGNIEIKKVAIIMAPTALAVDIAKTFITNATNDNGTATAVVSGGLPSYSYLWSSGEDTQMITDLTPATYTVTVTDNLLCTAEASAEVSRVDCGDTVYDSGGEAGNYSNQEDITTILCPDNPLETFAITFTSFDVEPSWDALYIHNGNSISSPLFDSGNPMTQANFPAGGYYGTTLPGPFESTDPSGCITLRFLSDQFVTGTGWAIDVSCTTYCSAEVTNQEDDGYGSLRRTIECADDGDVVPVSSSLNLETITVLSTIIVDKAVTVSIPSGSMYNIRCSDFQPIFTVAPSGSLQLDRVNLLSSEISDGGAIVNDGITILNDVVIYENQDLPNPATLIQNNGTLEIRGNTEIRKE